MRRVVVTGLGIVSCIGNDKKTVAENFLYKKAADIFGKMPSFIKQKQSNRINV